MLNLDEIGGHVSDADAFHVPKVLWDYLPGWMQGAHPHRGSIPLPEVFGLQITKYMVLELAVAVLMLAVFIPLARRIATGGCPKGRFWNFFETMLIFIRDEVARPAIGRKDADRFLPFIWNVFFFVLFCNLMGMLPWAGSPTGSLAVTGALALISFGAVLLTGMTMHGPVGFWTGMVPPMEVPKALAVLLKPGLLFIEVLGLLIKHSVLAMRLLANMFAGHLVLAVIIGFIAAAAHGLVVLWLGITIGSVAGATALSLLELFVAFLQAYIFAFLSALFIGMAVHQH